MGPWRRCIPRRSRKACAGRSTATLAGQAQKEAHINESLARLDVLAHPAIEAAASAPPPSASDGQAWLVAANATGDWQGHSDHIAARAGGQWLFVTPRDGLRVFNRATGQILLFNTGWSSPSQPALPSGGTTIDVEARQAIAGIRDCLVAAGILPSA